MGKKSDRFLEWSQSIRPPIIGFIVYMSVWVPVAVAVACGATALIYGALMMVVYVLYDVDRGVVYSVIGGIIAAVVAFSWYVALFQQKGE